MNASGKKKNHNSVQALISVVIEKNSKKEIH